MGPYSLTMTIHKNHDHGDRCACTLLALAVGCGPSAIGYNFCRSVLMKRWVLDCNHGCLARPRMRDTTQNWHDLGPVDPIKAILIHNE